MKKQTNWLPIPIKNMADVKKLLQEYKSVFLPKRCLIKIFSVIKSDELLYIIFATPCMAITNIATEERIVDSSRGVMFASNRRFVFHHVNPLVEYECQLSEIHFVAKHTGKCFFDVDTVSFSTSTARVELAAFDATAIYNVLLRLTSYDSRKGGGGG